MTQRDFTKVEDGRLQEILNTVFDWELIQTEFHEGGYKSDFFLERSTKPPFPFDLGKSVCAAENSWYVLSEEMLSNLLKTNSAIFFLKSLLLG